MLTHSGKKNVCHFIIGLISQSLLSIKLSLSIVRDEKARCCSFLVQVLLNFSLLGSFSSLGEMGGGK